MQDPTHRLRDFLADHQLSQSDLAAKAGVSQATVSRSLTKMANRHSEARIKLFTYAGIRDAEGGYLAESGNQIVLRAFQTVWDGTLEHARAIARIIEALDGLQISPMNRRGH